MTSKIERYTWDNALIEAGALGLIEAPSVNFALRISRAINWKPKDGKPLGLNWKNETAFKAVGTSTATYYRVKRDLMDNGFLIQKNGNLVPVMPDNVADLHTAYNAFVEFLSSKDSQSENIGRDSERQDSHIENEDSHIEKTDSQSEKADSHIENEDSQSDSPYSEDIYSDDSYSDDSSSEDALEASDADAPPRDLSENKDKDDPASLISEGNEVAGEARNDPCRYLENQDGGSAIASEEDQPDSQCENSEWLENWKPLRKMTDDELAAYIARQESRDTSGMKGTQLLAHRSVIKDAKAEQAKREEPEDDFWL